MTSLEATVDLAQLFADPTRVRLLALVAHAPHTVAELTEITELGQSRVSTHLGKLKEAGLVRDRPSGSSTYYGLNDGAMPPAAQRLWGAVAGELADAVLAEDRKRAAALIRARAGAQSWPDSVAGQLERHYSPGRTWEATARGLLGFVSLGDVLDVGSGDGAIAELFAPRVRSITCLDRSERMIAEARRRLGRHPHVAYAVADMHALPFESPCFDAVLCFNSLAYATAPDTVVREAARVLRPAGVLAVIALRAHRHAELAARYGHVNAGFTPAALRRLLEGAGLVVSHCAVSSRESRKPHFEVITAFAARTVRARAARTA
ncbi:MAG: ArsR family transcriptional regulator [Polyangiaceae bacterium]|nr:ArsR family transcriptional regulator [Polyangiaceae bacterium]